MLDVSPSLLTTPLNSLHLELGARMVPFAGYSMPVQYPQGLIAEHRQTRESASLFDVSHMGQLRLTGDKVCEAFESLIPMDVVGLPVGKQRYGLLLNEAGGILDDLMFFKRSQNSLFVIVNGACKAADMAHMTKHLEGKCELEYLPHQALIALQGPKAVTALSRLIPGVESLTFMTGGDFSVQAGDKKVALFLTRSGYTGEDGFEISVHQDDAVAFSKLLLAQPEVKAAGLGARNSLRLEAGLCLYGNDLDSTTNPVEADLLWSIQKIRRTDGARAGGFPGASKILALLDGAQAIERKRVGLIAKERIPVRDGVELQNSNGEKIGVVTSGLLSPVLDQAIAMAYVDAREAVLGGVVQAVVRGKLVAMEIAAMPFVPTNYYRG